MNNQILSGLLYDFLQEAEVMEVFFFFPLTENLLPAEIFTLT